MFFVFLPFCWQVFFFHGSHNRCKHFRSPGFFRPHRHGCLMADLCIQDLKHLPGFLQLHWAFHGQIDRPPAAAPKMRAKAVEDVVDATNLRHTVNHRGRDLVAMSKPKILRHLREKLQAHSLKTQKGQGDQVLSWRIVSNLGRFIPFHTISSPFHSYFYQIAPHLTIYSFNDTTILALVLPHYHSLSLKSIKISKT